MCLSTVYKNSKPDEAIMEYVSTITFDGDNVICNPDYADLCLLICFLILWHLANLLHFTKNTRRRACLFILSDSAPFAKLLFS